MLPNVGTGELLVILVVAVLLFGADRLPPLARNLGRALRSLKNGFDDVLNEVPRPRPPTEKGWSRLTGSHPPGRADEAAPDATPDGNQADANSPAAQP